MTRFDRTPEKTHRARSLRANATKAERKLWRRLKSKQIEGLKFRKQHPIGPYILDFYCPEVKLCIEVDGGQHNESSHIQSDATRTNFLEAHGVTVIRFWNVEIFDNLDGVVEAIMEQAWSLKREIHLNRESVPSPWKGEG
jgi:very-short-patch-repair endonuclease